MEPSSDPGRDEYGLPPVDIEIPNDARDLDRDVQAYHRELRALRRRMRIRRLTGPVMRRGLLIPLVAGCLAVTLLCGTLLTMISGHHAGPARPRRPPASSTSVQSPLPDARVEVAGKQVGLRTLVPALLAWIPVNCGCVPVLRQLVKQAGQAHVAIYFVATARAAGQLPALARQTGQQRSQVVNDTTDALSLYKPVGLTAILARRDATVGGVLRRLPSGDQRLVTELSLLAAPAPAASPVSPAHPATPAS